MKKGIILILSLPLILASCGGGSGGDEKSHTTKVSNFYVYENGSFKNYGIVPVHLFNGGVIPYTEVSAAYNTFQNSMDIASKIKSAKYSCALNGNVLTVTNEANNSTAKIDASTQVVTFSDYHGFKNPFPQQHSAFDFGYSMSTIIKSTKEDYVASKASEYSIDFSKYNIKIYFDNNQMYLPYDVMQNLFLSNGINFGYNGKNFYASRFKIGTLAEFTEAFKTAAGDGEIYKNKDYMQYTYDLLALTLDTQFGLKERKYRCDSFNTHKFLDGGAYKVLAPYKDRLISNAKNTQQLAMDDVFKNLIDDGGHTCGQYLSYLCNSEASFDPYGKELCYGADIAKKIGAARDDDKYKKYSHYGVTGDVDATASYYEKDGVAFICFDGFEGDLQTDYTKQTIDEKNYYKSTITLIHYADKQIRKNNIKKVVFDISKNSGGSIAIENFISSWAAPGSKFISKDINTGSISQITNKGDVNFDGKYDENDCLPKDVQTYCITSPVTFSCGTLFATSLKQFSNCKFMGVRAGGGACSVLDNMSTGIGSIYQLSSSQNLGYLDAQGNFVNDDDAFDVDFYKVDLTKENLPEFIDRDAQIKAINELK